MIEDVLIASGYINTAKKFIRYRELHKHRRDMAEKLMLMYDDLLFADAEDIDLKRDNANINTDAPMGIMLKLGTEGAKSYLNNYVLPDKFKDAHIRHIEHLHDADFSLITFNCLYVDLAKVLKNGFNTGHGFIREPKSIRAAASLACVIIQSSQNDCFGGQSLVGFDFALAKYVDMSFKKHLKKNIDMFLNISKLRDKSVILSSDYDKTLSHIRYNDNEDYIQSAIEDTRLLFHDGQKNLSEFIYRQSCKDVEEETAQAMEALVHNFNSLHSRAGKNGCRRIVVIRF